MGNIPIKKDILVVSNPAYHNLPSAYQEVEWIKNNNHSSNIILPIILNSPNNRILTKIQTHSYAYAGNSHSVMGFNNAYSTNRMTGIECIGTGGTKLYFANYGGVAIFGPNRYGLSKDIEIGRNIYYGGVLKATLTDEQANNILGNTSKFGMFGMMKNDTQVHVRCNVTTIYYLTFYDGNTLTADYIPCYRKADNVAGVYDIVNNQFYTGTGGFSVGADVPKQFSIPIKKSYIIDSNGVAIPIKKSIICIE